MSEPIPRFAMVDAADPDSTPADFVRGVARRLQPRLLLLAIGILLLTTVLKLIAYSAQTRYPVHASQWKTDAVIDAVFIVCVMLAVLVADEAVSRGAKRWQTYLYAVTAGCAFAAWAQWTLVLPRLPWENFLMTTADADDIAIQPFALFLRALFYASIGCFIYVNRRTARLAAGRMHAAEIARGLARRRTFESRLQAMQARVEPQFLFNTLAQVGELYEQDPGKAGQMLDDLISYLRAALPHLRESSSTLGRELDLARAYLDIMRVRLGSRLAFEIDIPDEVRGATMPPMMLLPLIDHALVYGLQPGDLRGSIRIETEARSGRLCISIIDSGVGFVPEGHAANLASIGERLHALYGDNARFELERMRERGTRATLEIPYETTDLRDR